ncbi:c-type cytochrome [Luteibacter yeojuensis]|uniref:Cytochrome c n=1 Tax=Luteibacter yeojuensis TaxID=345309 RepID=A0A7X5QX11_9GAMM|nr:cytochrome c [Luteibacter yeojuensis]NID17002.1 cytochrome c [Luteibacter yeojuensis]
MNTRCLVVCLAICAGPTFAQHIDIDPRKDVANLTGEQIYTQVCQGCHMPDAKGAVGAGRYPPLAGDVKLASGAYPAVMVMNGRGNMPAFGPMFTDAQIADVINYVRTHFGNAYTDSLEPDDVKVFRPPPPSNPPEKH